MTKKEEKITIKPENFAQMVLTGSPKKEDEDDLVYIKRQLRLYLEALMLAQDFIYQSSPTLKTCL